MHRWLELCIHSVTDTITKEKAEKRKDYLSLDKLISIYAKIEKQKESQVIRNSRTRGSNPQP